MFVFLLKRKTKARLNVVTLLLSSLIFASLLYSQKYGISPMKTSMKSPHESDPLKHSVVRAYYSGFVVCIV